MHFFCSHGQIGIGIGIGKNEWSYHHYCLLVRFNETHFDGRRIINLNFYHIRIRRQFILLVFFISLYKMFSIFNCRNCSSWIWHRVFTLFFVQKSWCFDSIFSDFDSKVLNLNRLWWLKNLSLRNASFHAHFGMIHLIQDLCIVSLERNIWDANWATNTLNKDENGRLENNVAHN